MRLLAALPLATLPLSALLLNFSNLALADGPNASAHAVAECAAENASPGSQEDYDRRVLRIYSTFAFELLNNQLRSLIWFQGFPNRRIPVLAGIGPMDEMYYKLWQQLDAALERLPVYTGKVYRGVGSRSPDRAAKTYTQGAIIREQAFTSSAKNEAAAAQFGPIILEIESRLGRDISTMSYNSAEAEVLFRTGSVFEVTKQVYSEGKLSRVLLRELDEKQLSEAQATALRDKDGAAQFKLMEDASYTTGAASLVEHANLAKAMIDQLNTSGQLEAQDLTQEAFEAQYQGGD